MAVSDLDIAAIHHLLVYSMAGTAARAPVDPQRSMEFIYWVATSKEGAVALMAFAGDKLVGSMGIVQTPYWYSRDTFLREVWMYVLPEYENRGVMAELLKEAKVIADLAGMSLFIAPTAKDRRRGARREHVATIYEFNPAGEIYAFHPKEN